MSSMDPSSPPSRACRDDVRHLSASLSIEGPAQDHYYTSCRVDVRRAALPVGETRLGAGRFEQLNGVAGRVVDHDLLAADADDQLSAQMDAGRAERSTVPARSATSMGTDSTLPAWVGCRPAWPARRLVHHQGACKQLTDPLDSRSTM
jgi:hypothetical protein